MKNKNYFTIYEICIMALLSVIGMYTKPLVAPVFNLLTDFIQIPGGSVSAGFSILFLVFAAGYIKKFGTASLMGIIQATMALTMGFSAQAGPLVYITYTLPGLATDLIICLPFFKRLPEKIKMMLAGAAGVLAGAVMSNLLYFRLSVIPFILFYSLGILSGILGGLLAYEIKERIPLPELRSKR